MGEGSEGKGAVEGNQSGRSVGGVEGPQLPGTLIAIAVTTTGNGSRERRGDTQEQHWQRLAEARSQDGRETISDQTRARRGCAVSPVSLFAAMARALAASGRSHVGRCRENYLFRSLDFCFFFSFTHSLCAMLALPVAPRRDDGEYNTPASLDHAIR